jgi:hypothetical protein
MFPHTLPAGQTLDCTYSAGLADSSKLTNTATVTTSGDVDRGEGIAEVDFTGVDPTNVVNETITADDTNQPDPLGTCSAGDVPCTFNNDITFTCDVDEVEHPNTATIVETRQSDDALVTVICLRPANEITDDDSHQVEIVVVGDEGCTPGFWKNHPNV